MQKNKEKKKYIVELTEEQMRVTQVALEEYFRLRLGQDYEFSNDMAAMGHDLSPENPNHDRIFDQYIHRRDHLNEIMRCYFRIAFDPYPYPSQKTEDAMIAECIWDAVRNARGESRFGGPMQIGKEPVPKIKRSDD